MYVNELLQTAQYVTDNQGKRQAVLLGMDIWEALIQRLEFTEDTINTERQMAMAREEAAYQAMYEELSAKYVGQYVAVYHGELIDRDEDGGRLYERVRRQYGDEFVLITPVGPEVEETYRVLSPHLIIEE